MNKKANNRLIRGVFKKYEATKADESVLFDKNNEGEYNTIYETSSYNR